MLAQSLQLNLGNRDTLLRDPNVKIWCCVVQVTVRLTGQLCGGCQGHLPPPSRYLHSVHQQVSQAVICKSCFVFARASCFCPRLAHQCQSKAYICTCMHTKVSGEFLHPATESCLWFSDRPDHIYSLSCISPSQTSFSGIFLWCLLLNQAPTLSSPWILQIGKVR